jgi:hypothetical protein
MTNQLAELTKKYVCDADDAIQKNDTQQERMETGKHDNESMNTIETIPTASIFNVQKLSSPNELGYDPLNCLFRPNTANPHKDEEHVTAPNNPRRDALTSALEIFRNKKSPIKISDTIKDKFGLK